MEKIVNQNINTLNKKKRFPVFVFLIATLLSLLVFVGYYYYSNYSSNTDNVSNNQQDLEESVFGRVVGEMNSDSKKLSYADQKGESRKSTIKAMMVGQSVFKVSENDIEFYLPDNCIVLKSVESENNGVSFLLIGSTDSQYGYQVGDAVDFFDYNISPQNIVVLTDDEIYKTSDDFSEFDLRSQLRPDSRIVFSCSSPSCSDNVINWVLVLLEDLNL